MHLCFEWTTAARIENHWRTQRVRILSVSVVFWRIVSNVMQSIYSFFSLFAQYIPQYSGKMLNKVGFITWRGDRYVSNHWVFFIFPHRWEWNRVWSRGEQRRSSGHFRAVQTDMSGSVLTQLTAGNSTIYGQGWCKYTHTHKQTNCYLRHLFLFLLIIQIQLTGFCSSSLVFTAHVPGLPGPQI